MKKRAKPIHSPRLYVEPLEERAVLAYVPFLEQPPILANSDGAHSVVVEDLDMDGDADILAGADRGIVWFENVNGLGTFGPARSVDGQIASGRSVRAADVDGDGDMDALSLSFRTTSWYENTDGRGTFGPPQVIAGGPGGTLTQQTAFSSVDFDLDGDIDVLLTTINEIFWFENTDGLGTFGVKQSLVERPARANDVHAADVDTDGDLDLLTFGRVFAWNENVGNRIFGPQRKIDDRDRSGYADSVSTADIDRDGDLDVFVASDQFPVAWYENTDSAGTFQRKQQITESRFHKSASLADIDGDDDVDVLVATADETVWFENTDGRGGFGAARRISSDTRVLTDRDRINEKRSIVARDMDGDGDLDVVDTSILDKKIRWTENVDGRGNFGREHLVDSAGPISDLSSVVPADVDNDGDLDVISASSLDGRVAWQENVDGFGSFGARQSISRQAIGIDSLLVGDLNGDGRQDVISVGRDDNRIAWHENLGTARGFAAEEFIVSETVMADSAFVSDLDGDGDSDLALGSQVNNIVAWSENLGGGQFGTVRILDGGMQGTNDVLAVDFDGDGDNDVVAVSYGDGRISWYENLDGTGSFSPRRLILRRRGALAIFPADVDGDGDIDLLAGGSIRAEDLHDRWFGWLENVQDNSRFTWHELPIASEAGKLQAMAADLDADGRVDILLATEQVTWFANKGGGEFTWESNFGGYPEDVSFGDLDNDGDLDILIARDDSVLWYRGEAVLSLIPFGEELPIASAQQPWSSRTADIDGDGDLDAVVGSYNRIAWYANNELLGSFQLRASIISEAPYVVSLDTPDIDRDGDLDLVVVADAPGDPSTGVISWYENLDGAGNFSSAYEIGRYESPASMEVSDLDGDGDVDLAVTGGRTLWFENEAGNGQRWRRHGIVDRYTNIAHEQGNSIVAADVDGDPDPDLILATGEDIVWYESKAGEKVFRLERRIQGDDIGASNLAVGDLDGDGDLDLISGWYYQIVWYENQDGRGTFGPAYEVTFEVKFVARVTTADVDNDGDEDVLSASSGDDKVTWYENVDGQGRFGRQHVIAFARNPRFIDVGDIDRDGDVDLVAALSDEQSVVWYMNSSPDPLSRVPGDANDDGRFDQHDIVAVLRAGRYRTGQPAGWREGDWNLDGVFNRLDLVFALQSGSFLQTADA